MSCVLRYIKTALPTTYSTTIWGHIRGFAEDGLDLACE